MLKSSGASARGAFASGEAFGEDGSAAGAAFEMAPPVAGAARAMDAGTIGTPLDDIGSVRGIGAALGLDCTGFGTAGAGGAAEGRAPSFGGALLLRIDIIASAQGRCVPERAFACSAAAAVAGVRVEGGGAAGAFVSGFPVLGQSA